MYFITAIIVFISDGLEYREAIHNEMPFSSLESCEQYLKSYESNIRLSITKASNYYRIELKEIEDVFCSDNIDGNLESVKL